MIVVMAVGLVAFALIAATRGPTPLQDFNCETLGQRYGLDTTRNGFGASITDVKAPRSNQDQNSGRNYHVEKSHNSGVDGEVDYQALCIKE